MPAPPSPVFAIGEIVSEIYEIRRIVGTGGMAQVFEAHDRLLNRRVAIKAPRSDTPPLQADEPPPLRLEAQALAAVRHPGIVTVFGMGRHRGIEYLLLEFVAGMSLDAHFRDKTAFSIDEIIDILTALADALAAVHRAGGAHCDVKPSNVILAPGGRIVLMDLGIFRPEVHGTPDLISGTPHYMAPEVIENSVQLGAWHLVDLYALGVLGYELCTGKRPYDGANVIEVLDLHLHASIPDVAKLRPDVPPRLRRLLAELMAKSPSDRPPGAEHVTRQLQEIARAVNAPRREGPMTVLIVDDSPEILQILRLAVELTLPGVEVHTAPDARAALDLFRVRAPDVMLLDLQLPGGMSGVELCMYLRGTENTSRCTIVPISGQADEADVELLQRLGVTHFLPKSPTMVRDLGALLRQLGTQGRA